MGEQYIRKVSRKLNLSRSRKKEILHDLEELFAEAASHGETEEEVIKRLRFTGRIRKRMSTESQP